MHPPEASEPRGSTRQRPLAEKYYPEPESQRNRKIFFPAATYSSGRAGRMGRGEKGEKQARERQSCRELLQLFRAKAPPPAAGKLLPSTDARGCRKGGNNFITYGLRNSFQVPDCTCNDVLFPFLLCINFQRVFPLPLQQFFSLPCWCCPPLSAPCCLTPELCQAPSCGCKAHADVQLGLDPTPQRDLRHPQQQISPQAWRKGALHQAQLQAAGLVPRCSERVRGTSGENGNEGLQS